MDYCGLLSVFPYLSFSNRMKLSAISPKCQKQNERYPYSIKSIMFSQPYGLVNQNGVTEEVGSGELHVESIVYNFEYNEETNQVRITCSLTPDQEKVTDDKTVARRYFQHYLTSSKCSVEHVHLVECHRPFRNLTNLRVPSLTWVLNLSTQHALFQNFSNDHVFEKLEFINAGAAALLDRQTRRAKHVVVENRGIYQEHVIGNELVLIAVVYTELNNKINVTQGLNDMYHFTALCIYIEHPRVHVGSSVTGRFKRSGYLKDYLWDTLLSGKRGSCKGHLKGKECVVTKLRREFVIAVFHNYFNEDDEETESFTVFKFERNQEPEIDRIEAEEIHECEWLSFPTYTEPLLSEHLTLDCPTTLADCHKCVFCTYKYLNFSL